MRKMELRVYLIPAVQKPYNHLYITDNDPRYGGSDKDCILFNAFCSFGDVTLAIKGLHVFIPFVYISCGQI